MIELLDHSMFVLDHCKIKIKGLIHKTFGLETWSILNDGDLTTNKSNNGSDTFWCLNLIVSSTLTGGFLHV